MCSSMGLLATGIIGFGRLMVSGLKRVPYPPAMTTAFMVLLKGTLAPASEKKNQVQLFTFNLFILNQVLLCGQGGLVHRLKARKPQRAGSAPPEARRTAGEGGRENLEETP